MSQADDIATLRRSSQRSGLVTLFGAIIVFSALGYSAWRLVDLQSHLDEVSQEIAELTPARDALRGSKADLERENTELASTREGLLKQKLELEEAHTKLEIEVQSLRAERDRLRQGYEQLGALADPNISASAGSGTKTWQRNIAAAMPLSASVRPRVQRTAIDASQSRFALSLELPANLKPQVRRVTYLLNHETLRHTKLESADAATNFGVEYTGWGCLDSVVATIDLQDGASEQLVFDMCAVLRQGLPNEPVNPARPPPRPPPGSTDTTTPRDDLGVRPPALPTPGRKLPTSPSTAPVQKIPTREL